MKSETFRWSSSRKFSDGENVLIPPRMSFTYLKESDFKIKATIVRVSFYISRNYPNSIMYIVNVPSIHSPTKSGNWLIPEFAIRPVPDDKQESGSWEEIEKLYNWNPTKIEETVS